MIDAITYIEDTHGSLAHLPDVLGRIRLARRARAGPLAWLAAAVPPEMIGVLRLERTLWRGFVCWLRRSPAPAAPDGLQLGFLELGSYRTVVAIVLLLACVELPVDGMIASLLIKGEGARRAIHIGFLLAGVYSIVLVLGDRWLVCARGHVLAGDLLDLRAGTRAAARVPLAAIDGWELLREPRAQWCRRHGVSLGQTAVVSPVDRPNLVLRLKPGADVCCMHWQRERGGVSCIFVYLDRPETLLHVLGRRLA
jgi:hypothetical protein